MWTADVQTPWQIGDTERVPLLAVAYTLPSMDDLTGTPAADITAATVETVRITCDQATLAAIQADGRFTVVSSAELPDSE